MKLKEIKIADFNRLDDTIVGYYNPPLRISDKEEYSCISNTSDNVYRGISFTPLVKKIEFWGKQVINGYNWYNFFVIGIKVNNAGLKEDREWVLVNSNSTGIEWRPHTEVVAPIYSLNTWYHWTIYLDEDNCPWYDMSDEEGNLLYSGKFSEYPVIQFNYLAVVCPYQSDISYLRDISVYIEDTLSSESNEFLDKEGLIKVWEQIGKKYYSKKEVDNLISNITPSAGDNNEIITANNILFSLPTVTSLVEDEEGTVYTLTDKTVLGE